MDRMYAAPPPRKVRQGVIAVDRLQLETMGGDQYDIAWTSIRCIFVGRMEPAPSAPASGGGARPSQTLGRMMAAGVGGPIGKAAFNAVVKKSSQDATSASASMVSAYSIIDLWLDGDTSPLRFETTGTNMRILLGEEAGYSADINYLLLLKRLAPLAPHAVHATAALVIERGRTALKVFSNRDDLYLASRRANEERATPPTPS